MTEPALHTPHDPLAVVHRQIGEALTQLGALKANLETLVSRRDKDSAWAQDTLSSVEDDIKKVSRTLESHGEILETIPDLVSRVNELAELLPPAIQENAYKPTDTRRWWWELDPDNDAAPGSREEHQKAREEALADLREWVETIYRPYFGWLSEPLGECWDRHLMALVVIDGLAEMWSYLYLSAPRTPALLSRQLEFQVRVAKELADQLARECPRSCEAHR